MLSIAEIKKLAEQRILILDGGMGTMIQAQRPTADDFHAGPFADHPVPLTGDNDVLNITKPEFVLNVHRAYLEAGADIIATNTFNCNAVSQTEYGLAKHVYDMAFAAARNARKIADEYTAKNPAKPRLVGGSIGPTGRSASLSPDVMNPTARAIVFDELADAYQVEIEALIHGGADLLMFETCFDTLNCKAGLYAARIAMKQCGHQLPVIVSATFSDASRRVLSGQTPEAFYCSVAHAPNLLAVGCNCGLGAEALRPCIEEFSACADCLVITYPNAGLPDAYGHYSDSPEQMASEMRQFALEGLINIAGGCCGTTPEHIRAVADALDGISPRRIPEHAHEMHLSGLNAFSASRERNFINIGERTNVAGSRKFLRIIREGDMPSAMQIARGQINAGASMIDINMDDPLLDAEDAMRKFLFYAANEPEIAAVPFMIDSSNWDVVKTALRCVQGKSIVNSISLKEGEEAFLRKAEEIHALGAAVLVMAFDEQGQADTLERRTSILSRSVELLKNKAEFAEEDIALDPNVFAVATGIPAHDSYGIDFIRATAWLRGRYPACSISGGISNVSFSFRGNEPVRRALHCVFLKHAIDAGLNMGIVNPAQLEIYDTLDSDLRAAAEAVILNSSPDAGEKLLAIAAKVQEEANPGAQTTQNVETWRTAPLAERIALSLIKGDDSYVQTDMMEALADFESPMRIVEGPLMDGMKRVGTLFSEGKMFLPQVIKTARVMKQAVSVLMPEIEKAAQSGSGLNAPVVVLATVKGDVHDIGKNIVGAVLQCNNCTVHDLGVMTPEEVIADAAVKYHADIVGLSGLITPSLREMEHVVAEFQRRGLRIPILVGGAAASEQHTALKLKPIYDAPVLYTADAAATVLTVNALMNPNTREQFLREAYARYELFTSPSLQKSMISFDMACKRAVRRTGNQPVPSEIGQFTVEFSMESIRKQFNWDLFLHTWKMPAGHSAPKEELLCDARKILDSIQLRIKCAYAILPVSVQGETVTFPDTNTGITFPRNQNGDCLCVADYIGAHLGMFVVTVQNADVYADTYRPAGDDYSALLIRSLANIAAEAGAELAHAELLKSWGVPSGTGIRPAPGYPTIPDHSLKREIFALTDAENKLQVKLTENFMMQPESSVCGFVIPASDAVYFPIDAISNEQIQILAEARHFSVDRMGVLLGQNIESR